MSANLGVSTGFMVQSNRSRSQLVANRILITLGQVFWLGTFTSRDVSNRLGLDFLYVCKTLSKMSRKPYYVLSATRVSRVSGGFENVYTISVKGWGKICHFAGQSQRVQEPMPVQPQQMEGSCLLGASRVQVERDYRLPYLLIGKGTAEEYALLGIPPDGTATDTPIERIRPANISGIMTGLNFAYLFVEGCCGALRSVGHREDELAIHMAGLQALGLTPSHIRAPLYANAARYLGATKEEIYITLLAQRCIELQKPVPQPQDEPSELRKHVSQLHDELSKTKYDSAMKRIELRLESARQLIRISEVEKSLRSELLDHGTFLHELFLRLSSLESIIPDHYGKCRIKKIQYAIMEFELSTLKRRQSAAN